MQTASEMIRAAASLYPRRVYDDEQATAVRSVQLAAKVDWEVEHSGEAYKPWYEAGYGLAHPQYKRAMGLVAIAEQELTDLQFPTDGHRAQAIFAAALAMDARGLRGTELAAIKEICRAAAPFAS